MLQSKVHKAQQVYRPDAVVHRINALRLPATLHLLLYFFPYPLDLQRHLLPDQIGRIIHDAVRKTVLLLVLKFDQKFFPGVPIRTQQVKGTAFFFNNKAVELLVDKSNSGNVLSRQEQFEDLNYKFFVFGGADNYLESGIRE